MYILEGIEVTAEETQARVKKMLGAMENATKLIKSQAAHIYSKDLVEIIFKHPYCKIRFLEQANIAKWQTAATYLKTLEGIGLLKSVKVGREYYYINETLIKILKK